MSRSYKEIPSPERDHMKNQVKTSLKKLVPSCFSLGLVQGLGNQMWERHRVNWWFVFFLAVCNAIRNLVFLLVCPDLPVNNHKQLCHLQAATLQSHLPRSQPSLLSEGEETSEVLLWGIKTQEDKYIADFKARAQGVAQKKENKKNFKSDLCATKSKDKKKKLLLSEWGNVFPPHWFVLSWLDKIALCWKDLSREPICNDLKAHMPKKTLEF